MKLTTMHVMVGVGAIRSAIAVGVSTKLACDKVEEVRQVKQATDPSFTDLTGWEKFKIGLPYYLPPLLLLSTTVFGITECYIGSQEAIKIATDNWIGTTVALNGYRDLARKEMGMAKEAEIYNKIMAQQTPKASNIILGERDCLCKLVISPTLYDGFEHPPVDDTFFVSNPTKIREGVLAFNEMFIRRVKHSMLNDASATIGELNEYLGSKDRNHLNDRFGWSYGHDGTVDVLFESDLTEDQKPYLRVLFKQNPHYID